MNIRVAVCGLVRMIRSVQGWKKRDADMALSRLHPLQLGSPVCFETSGASLLSFTARSLRILEAGGLFLMVAWAAETYASSVYSEIYAFGIPGTNRMDGVPQGIIEASDGRLYGTTSSGGVAGKGTVFRVDKGWSGYTNLYDFPNAGWERPRAGVIEASDGRLYGTTTGGIGTNDGVVFSLKKDGTGYTVLHSVGTGTPGGDIDGENVESPLLEASDGMLYGIAEWGGTEGQGTIFRLAKDGTGFAVVHNFYPNPPYGGPLVEGADGKLYGTTTHLVFRMNKDGTGFLGLQGYSSIGGFVDSGVIQGSDGMIYGTSSNGGAEQQGSVFRMNKDGTGFSTILSFPDCSSCGTYWLGSVIEGRDGLLYGITPDQSVFALSKDGKHFEVIKDFQPGDGSPGYALIQATNGVLYGYGSSVYRLNTNGSDFTSLNVLPNLAGDGGRPLALAAASDDHLYGVTLQGGTNGGYGTVYGISTDGSNYRQLHSFSGILDGSSPVFRLLEGSDGFLYGTTAEGGAEDRGVVFKLGKDGRGFSVIRSFQSGVGDGLEPSSGLVEGTNGVLYGTTRFGGIGAEGTLFQLRKNGTDYEILKHFPAFVGDARHPNSLLAGTDGALYGTTLDGGGDGGGTVFKLSAGTTVFTILWHFWPEGPSGAYPASLMEASDGLLYGTTSNSVFRLTKTGGDLQVVYQFDQSQNDYAEPISPLVEGPDGRLYGIQGFGDLYRVAKDGSNYELLRSSVWSSVALTINRDGSLFGTLPYGGTAGFGTVFRLDIYEDRISVVPSSAGITLEFTGHGGLNYALERSINLTIWTNLTTLAIPQGSTVQFDYEDPSPPPSKAFYRTRVWQ